MPLTIESMKLASPNHLTARRTDVGKLSQERPDKSEILGPQRLHKKRQTCVFMWRGFPRGSLVFSVRFGSLFRVLFSPPPAVR